jgi:hypothetical protein
MRIKRAFASTVVSIALMFWSTGDSLCQQAAPARDHGAATPNVAVGSQYDTTHVYVTPTGLQSRSITLSSIETRFAGRLPPPVEKGGKLQRLTQANPDDKAREIGVAVGVSTG